MSNLVVIQEGDLIRKDPADSKVFAFDWDYGNLAPAVQISTSTFTITEASPFTAWSALTNYVANDYVTSASVLYVCLVPHINQIPPNATYWAVVSAFTALTKDSEARLTAAEATTALQRTITVDNRVTRLRLIGGTLGQTYTIANKAITNETPAQTKERSFRVIIEEQ
jgi:hypothetical protein